MRLVLAVPICLCRMPRRLMIPEQRVGAELISLYQTSLF